MSTILTRAPYRWALLAFAALALAITLAPRSAGADPAERVHPAVAVFADQHPRAGVPVVIQTEGDPAPVIDRVRAEGGSVLAQFQLTNGFAALLPAADLDKFARDGRVDWISLNAYMVSSDGPAEEEYDHPSASYPAATGATAVWAEGYTGQGITVAVVDSGIAASDDFQDRLVGSAGFASRSPGQADRNGHGTHVAGVIAGDSHDGRYVGIAPEAGLLSVKVSDREGAALVSDVIQALDWIVSHKDEYGIRVVNISMNSSLADSYRRDPLDAAVEQAWFHGLVVVVSAGNSGSAPFAADHAPANDPYVITVGSFDDRGTPDLSDDAAAEWSSRGLTADGVAKPEVLAPGAGIVSTLARGSYLAQSLPGEIVDSHYLRLSGTSPSAAAVSGVVALMLEREPGLTPDQVKSRLMHTGAALPGSEAPRVDAYAAAFSTPVDAANQGLTPSDFIDPSTGSIVEDSVLWRDVLWRSILWRSVLWNNVLWSR